MNKAIPDEYGLNTGQPEDGGVECPFCSATNQADFSECRQCGRPLSLKQQTVQEDKLHILDRLRELEEKGVLEKLKDLDKAFDRRESSA